MKIQPSLLVLLSVVASAAAGTTPEAVHAPVSVVREVAAPAEPPKPAPKPGETAPKPPKPVPPQMPVGGCPACGMG